MPPNLPPGFYLLVAAGLCFGLQHKVPWPRNRDGKTAVLDRLLACSYCTGFHCGWLTWGLWFLVFEQPALGRLQQAVSLLSWCFACAWICYALDTVVKRLEVPHE